MMRYYCKYK